jgi:hypothetical protein
MVVVGLQVRQPAGGLALQETAIRGSEAVPSSRAALVLAARAKAKKRRRAREGSPG